MKKFIALAVLVGTTSSFASDRDIFDIMYLPDPGTTYGFTTGEFADGERESDELGDLEASGYAITQTIGHAFTDRFSIEASLDYTNLEYDPESADEYDLTGVSDPTVSARFRTMDEKFRWDVVGGATISFMDREIESNNDRNNLQGGHSLFVGTQFGVKTEIMQWALAGLIVHNMKTETEFEVDGGNDVDVEDDANNELIVRGDLVNKLGNNSYLRSNIQASFTEEFEDDQNPEQKTAPSTTHQIGTEFQQLFSEDVLFRAGVDYQQRHELSGQIDSIESFIYRLGVNYQF